jgi:hypothetical protein
MAEAEADCGRRGAEQGPGGARIGGLPPGAFALVLLLAVLAAVGWSNTLHEHGLVGWQKSVIVGTAPAPDQYRVLTPWLTDGIFCWTAPQTVDEALRTLRLFVPLLPVLIPLAVLGLTPAHEADE